MYTGNAGVIDCRLRPGSHRKIAMHTDVRVPQSTGMCQPDAAESGLPAILRTWNSAPACHQIPIPKNKASNRGVGDLIICFEIGRNGRMGSHIPVLGPAGCARARTAKSLPAIWQSSASVPDPRQIKAKKNGLEPGGKRPFFLALIWSEREDSNLRPPDPETGALPDCATLRHWRRFYSRKSTSTRSPATMARYNLTTITTAGG